MSTSTGIHHVTAMAGSAQENVDFYTGVLGLRFVKRTVNYDDPLTYHLYYGDEVGRPGTAMTFFPWGAASLKGRIGTGQVSVTAFSIPRDSVDFWIERLARNDVAFDGPADRFGDQVLSLEDPDGLGVELVTSLDDPRPAWGGIVAAEHALRGFHHATLSLASLAATARVLTEVLGFFVVGDEGARRRFAAGAVAGTMIDLLHEPDSRRGTMGIGVVHHIAFRATTDEDQLALRERVIEAGLQVTEVIDRHYFHSVYFREPGGVLFEIATDTPGFTIDEPAAELGRHLKLPAWYEPQRDHIESRLPPLVVPRANNQ